MEDIGTTIGGRIVFFRKLKGWTQTQLWKAAGMTQSHMSDIENNNAIPSFEEVDRIALFLEQPLQYFSIVRKVVLPPELGTTPQPKIMPSTRAGNRKSHRSGYGQGGEGNDAPARG